MKIQSLLVFIYALKHIECKGQLQSLDETTWSDMLAGEWMVEFFAPWCPACQQLKPLWEEFAKWSDDLGIKVANVDVTMNPGLSGRFMITALPTIFHVKDGVFRQYRGARDKESFFSFVEEKKWQLLEPVSSWKSPQSYQMTTIAYFFKISMMLRSVHNSLVQDYGLPYWFSYIFFGLATVILGAILGLIIVCILDFVCRLRTGDNVCLTKSPYSDVNNEEMQTEEYESEDIQEDMHEDVIQDGHGDADLRRRGEASTEQ